MKYTVTDLDGNSYAVWSLEIKMLLSDGSVNEVKPLVRTTPYVNEWNSAKIREVVPNEHLCQIIYQGSVLKLNIVLYFCASETAILYYAVIHIQDYLLNMARLGIVLQIGPCIDWAHERSTLCIPTFIVTTWKDVINSHLPMWQTINDDVREHGPLPPINLFRTDCKRFTLKLRAWWMVWHNLDHFSGLHLRVRPGNTKWSSRPSKLLRLTRFSLKSIHDANGAFKEMEQIRSKMNSIETFFVTLFIIAILN